MRVQHLAVVSFMEPKSKLNIETRGAAAALIDRVTAPDMSHPPLSLTHVEVDIPKQTTLTTRVKGRFDGAHTSAHANPRDYGAYVLFHNLLDFGFDDYYTQTEAPKTGAELARVFTDVVVGNLGFPRLGKVCMIACSTAPSKQGAEVQMGDHFTAGLAVACADYRIAPPLVAGWDDFMTVAFEGNPSLQGSSVNTPANFGHKVTTKRNHKVLARRAPARKWVWVYGSGIYTRTPAAGSGWSDKTTVALAGTVTVVIPGDSQPSTSGSSG